MWPSAAPLQANESISNRGVKLFGAGFIVTPEEAANLGLGSIPGLERHIRLYRNGRDLTATPRDVMVIDLFGLTAEEVRARFPAVYQWVYERVKPERDQNNRAVYRRELVDYGEPRPSLRDLLCRTARYIATVETSKHRFFVFLDAAILPDNKLVNIALDDAYFLGVLSSRIHVTWALAAGGRLGVGNDPRLQQDRLLRDIPLPRRHRRAAGAHPRPGRAVGRAPQAPAGAASQADPDRHVQRAGEAAGRRAADRQGQGGPRAGAGQRAAATPRRAGRGRVRRLRLAGHAHRRGDPGAAGGPQRRARRRRSAGSHPLAAARIPGARRSRNHVSRSTP